MAIIIKCANPQCENYGHELNEGMEVCDICGTATEKSVTKVNNKLGMIVVFALFAAFLIYWGVNLWVGFALFVACVVAAVISRSKPAAVISILALLGIIARMVYILFLI